MNPGRELAELFNPPPSGAGLPVDYRQGVVVEWNPVTAENAVLVDGSTFENLPVLNTSEVLLLAPGSVVGILCIGRPGGARTWVILGRLTVPGTANAASALDAPGVRLRSEDVSALDSTSSTGFTDLTTVGPTVTDVPVGNTGSALVILSAELTVPATRAAGMGVDVSGATTVAADGPRSLGYASGATDANALSSSRVILFSGPNKLNKGLHTFTAKYRSTLGGSVTFAERNVTVIPY